MQCYSHAVLGDVDVDPFLDLASFSRTAHMNVYNITNFADVPKVDGCMIGVWMLIMMEIPFPALAIGSVGCIIIIDI